MTTDELLARMASLLNFGDTWHARAVGSSTFAKGSTPRAAMLTALGLSDAVVPASGATRCSVCQQPQFDTPSGIACPFGHGGVDPADDDEPNADLF